MGLLGNKKKKNSTKGSAKKGGVLGMLGIQTEALPTETDKQDVERDKQIKLAWVYLRSRIDLAVHDYYRTGQFTKLEEFVERPALDALKQELHSLRSDNIFWSQEDRKSLTEPQMTVVHVDTNKRKQPIKFTIRERYKDFATHQRVVDQQLVPEAQCNGTERVIEAVVTVTNGSQYKLHSCRQVRTASLS